MFAAAGRLQMRMKPGAGRSFAATGMNAVKTKLCEASGPFHETRTRLRIALPSIITLSGSASSNASVSGRSTGRHPYSFSQKISFSSARRTFSHVATSFTGAPAFVTISGGTSFGSDSF